jgi:isopenicillin-N N-acyltransferase-like protein
MVKNASTRSRWLSRSAFIGTTTAASIAVALFFVSRLLDLTVEYRPRSFEGGSLQLVEGLPLLQVQGTPEQIGRQMAELTQEVNRHQGLYLGGMQRALGQAGWKRVSDIAHDLEKQMPERHLREIKSFADANPKDGVELETLVVAQSAFDILKGLGCSTLIVEPQRSGTGHALMGRNFDYNGGGVLHRCCMVTVVRGDAVVEDEKVRPFVMVGWSWTRGPITGMNDAGLCLAINESYKAADGSPKFDSSGIPRPQFTRRILEECANVDEAVELVKTMPRTCQFSLTLCDPTKGCVIELTPKSAIVRDAEQGICACTNHFFSDELIVGEPTCSRLESLEKCRAAKGTEGPKLGVADVFAELGKVDQGVLTLHSVVFEPAARVIHVAIGELPSTSGKLVSIDCKPLFAGK